MAEKQTIGGSEECTRTGEGNDLQKTARDMVGKNIELVEDLQKKALEELFEQLHETIRQKKVDILGSTLKEYTADKNQRFQKFTSEQGRVKVWNLFRHLGRFVSGLGELDPLMQLFFLQCDQLTHDIMQLHVPTELPQVEVSNLSIPEAIQGKKREVQFKVTYRTEGEVVRNFKEPKHIEVVFRAAEAGTGTQTVPVEGGLNGTFTATFTPTSEGQHTLTVTLCSCRLKPSLIVWVQPPISYDRLQGPTKVSIGPGRPQFLQLCEDGKLLVTVTGHLRKNQCSIRKFDGSGRVIEASEGTPAEIELAVKNPGGVVQLGGKVFIVDTLTSTFSFYDSSGPPSLQAVDTDVHLCHPHGLCADKDGNLYLADTKNGRVRVFEPVDEDRKEYKCKKTIPDEEQPPLSFPIDVALDDYGNLYVTCEGSKSVEVFDRTGLRYLEKSLTGLKDVFGIAVNCLGYVFVTLRRPPPRGKIKIFDPQGKFIEKYAGLWYPIGITIDRSGSVYVADQRGVQKYTS